MPLRLCLYLAGLIAWANFAFAEGPASKRLTPGELLAPATLEPGTLLQETNADLGLHIVVVEGEDGVNIVKKKTAVQPVVEVRDRNNVPVSGALVIFTTPGHGASAAFLNGSRSVSLVTDSGGRAAIVGMKPVGTGGFKIEVSASYRNQKATATIAQTNFLTAAAASAAGAAAGGTAGGSASGVGGLSPGVIGAIVGGIAAAVAGTVIAVTHGGGTQASTAPTITIGSPGTSTVGAPH